MRVAICVATCTRPVSLGRLLESLAKLTFRKHSSVEPTVVVVDNDGAESAREVVERARTAMPFPIVYAVEEQRNISLARNRALELALTLDPEFVAFIDDDETAHPAWLDELIDVQRQFGADVVGGSIVPRYEEGVPDWIVSGRFFGPIRHPTGRQIRMAYTGNVLLARSLLSDPSCRFDPAFGITGGGDSHFFMRAYHHGARMVWANEAVVEELVPVSRASTEWILRRAFRVGNGYVFCERSLLPRHRWLLPRIAKAVFRITEGILLVAPSAVGGRAPVVRSLRKVAHGAGCLAALVGVRYREYDVIHGN